MFNNQDVCCVSAKIVKAKIDFDSFDDLKKIIKDFEQDIIGVRSLTMYKNFVHKTVSLIRPWGFNETIIIGGPYSTRNYTTALMDSNIEL